jgi:putative DNA primase/helicase
MDIAKLSLQRALGINADRAIPIGGYPDRFGGGDARATPSATAAASGPSGTLGGLVHVLTSRPEWRGNIALDTFARRVVLRRPPPYDPERPRGKPIGDEDHDRIRLWLERTLGLAVARARVADAVRIVAAESAFHPVADYLDALVWDGVPRVDTWLETYAGVVPESPAHRALVRAVSRKWLVSCVARAKAPGCKVDTMLILEGAQGIGKSRALAALAGEAFFCDSLLDIRSKEACQTIQGVWIYELAELDALLGRETSVTKAFLSRAVDRFRSPYGRVPEVVPRSVVFCGTVNHGGYLKDRTGNRRFWVMRCSSPLDPEGLGAARDALWAEARARYEAGEPWHLGLDDEARMREEQAARVEGDPWEDVIAAWTTRRAGATFTMNELLEGGLGLSLSSRNPTVTSRARRILEGLGFERRRAMASGRRSYFYARAHEGGGAPLPHCPTSNEIAFTNHHFSQEEES